MPASADAGRLPGWRRVLAVVAHPDDESFGLGAVLERLASASADVGVLCLTAGEASTHGKGPDLAGVRAGELAQAAQELGLAATWLLHHRDGALADVAGPVLDGDVAAAVDDWRPDGLVVFDPLRGVTGHPDHAAASEAAVRVAAARGIPVLGWALPDSVSAVLNEEFGADFAGYAADRLDLVVTVDRAGQRRAIAAHASQAVPGSVLWRRLELLGPHEYLRRLV